MGSVISEILRNAIKTWRTGSLLGRATVVAAGVLLVAAAAVYLLGQWVLPPFYSERIAIALGIGALALAGAVSAYQESLESEEREKKIERVERRYEEDPAQPQAAWELARVKLEKYIDRNLSQVRSIFWLTVLVMVAGFVLIAVGVVRLFSDPAQLSASVLSAASGVLLNFVAATFLAVYRATMAQAGDYVTILERINAVGMSVQILESLKDAGALQQKTTAEIATGLLHLYAEKRERGPV